MSTTATEHARVHYTVDLHSTEEQVFSLPSAPATITIINVAEAYTPSYMDEWKLQDNGDWTLVGNEPSLFAPPAPRPECGLHPSDHDELREMFQ